MQAYSPTFYGTVTLNGSIACAPTTGRKIDIYNDGSTIYGMGLNDFEYCIFGGEGSALTYRIGAPGAIDLAGAVAFRVTATGINGTGIGADTPAPGRFSTLFSASVDLEGGAIDNTPIGATTPSTLRGTTLALTGSLTAKFVLAAPNAAAGAPTWRQLLYTDLSGTIENVAIGGTTAAAGRFTTLTHTGFLLRSSATGLTASTTNTQAGALGLTASVNNITTAAANSAVRLPNAAPATNTAAEIIVRNGGANAVNVFPVSGAAINALAANAAYSLAAGASVRFMQLSSTLYVTA